MGAGKDWGQVEKVQSLLSGASWEEESNLTEQAWQLIVIILALKNNNEQLYDIIGTIGEIWI